MRPHGSRGVALPSAGLTAMPPSSRQTNDRRLMSAAAEAPLREGFEVAAQARTPSGWKPRNLPLALMTLFPTMFPTTTQAKKACRRKTVEVDGVRQTSAYILSPNAHVRVIARASNVTTFRLHAECSEPTEALEIAYEDDHIAVVVKPAGIDTMGSRSLESMLLRSLQPTRAPLAVSGGALRRPK